MTKITFVLLTSLIILTSSSSALKCDFLIDSNKNYICELSNAAPSEHIFSHTISGYGDENVTIVSSIIDEKSTLPVLDDVLMTKFVNLRKIDISFFKIKEVKPNAFKNCENIEEISLNRNELSELPVGVFKDCKKLKIVKFVLNLFQTIPNDGFEGLEGLDVLKFDQNPILHVQSNDFGTLVGLKELYLSGVVINDFTAYHLENLEVIDLRNNSFELFEVKKFSKLRSLNLSKNLLTSIKFDGSSNLTELDVSMNALSDLPLDAFINATNLKILRLSYNPKVFKNFSRGIFEGLTNLEVLELKTCEIEELSGFSFYLLENLRDLDLSHNQIRELPYIFSFRTLKNLETLKISSNSLEQIKSTTFMKLTSLKILDLSHNLIHKIQNSSFKFLENLEKLNLGSNKIEVLQLDMFPIENSKLIELDVSYNSIKAIEPDFRSKLPKNTEFYGTGNSCVDENPTENLESCYENYENLQKELTTYPTATEESTEENVERLEFTLKDLLITLICIIFIAILLFIAVFYINGLLTLLGINEKPKVVENNINGVNYERF